MSAIKSDRDYLIGAEVVIETNCLPILVMISSCTMPDMAMLHWIAYVKSLYPEIQHVAGKGNVVVDILSRARYSVKEDPHSDEEDVGLNLFTSSYLKCLLLSEKRIRKANSWRSVNSCFLFKEMNLGQWKASIEFERKRTIISLSLEHAKKKNGTPIRLICKREEKQTLMSSLHDSVWADH